MSLHQEPADSVPPPGEFAASLFSTADLKWQSAIRDVLDSLQPHQRAVLGLLAISHHCQRNPATLLTQLGTELRGKQGFKLLQLATKLAEGSELFQTLEQYPKLLPPQALILLRLAQDEGMLTKVYALVKERFPRVNASRDPGAGAGFSLSVKVLVVFFVLGFMFVRIFPELEKILVEFGVESKRFSLALNYLDSLGWGLAILFGLFVMFVILWLLIKFLQIVFGYRPWLSQPTPASVTRKRFLAWLADSGGVNRLIERFSSSPALNRLLPGLNSVRNRMLQGQNFWSALAGQRLVSPSEANLISSASPETQAWLMRWKAARQERWIQSNWAIGRRVVWIVIQIGLVLAVLVASMLVMGSLIDIFNVISSW